ncbi:MAG: dTDP-4-dehydrorhamnose 3,5-epimerase [Dysgonamonadaceae bacterium]|jgi:dTDP-4-dehydrorhamnose 3,5-epimerase|nr:dTDP-4-dehydrorhamnose 3,5-epimerase [Dysgonamonadaceae bacterium]
MTFAETKLSGLYIIEPKVWNDSRGYFMEAFKKAELENHIGSVDFIQENESVSTKNVLRGLHYQEGDAAQAKLVRVIKGRVWDVAVDIRKNSPTYGHYELVELSEENKRQLFIPRGFAHGFLVLSDYALFLYKVDNVYFPTMERTIDCFDSEINIPWPISPDEAILSEKDKNGKAFKDI